MSTPASVNSLCECSDTGTHPLCGKLRALDIDQRALCRDFITETMAEMLRLNQGRSRVPFRIALDAILVPDPDGNLRPVAAATNLGPDGDIAFHYDSARALSPILFLALMAHEFGHKVSFRGQYVDDNPPIGAFDFLGGGRALMDAVGAGLAWYAWKVGLVGREFGVMDTFSCDITETTTGMGLPAMGDSPRLFLSNASLDAYETGIGFWPGQLPCNWRNDQHSVLSFQLKIHEEHGCAMTQDANAHRFTTLEVWLYHLPVNDGDDPPPPERLLEKQLPGFNPICEDDPTSPLEIDLPFATRDYHVEMRYRRSTGRIQ